MTLSHKTTIFSCIMSSPQSLLGLVSQLQHIEQKLTDILLEAAMKMTSLTDSCVFILVETQDGRKFTGNRRLCESYRNCQMFPKDTDVECLVDVEARNISNAPFQGLSSYSHPPSNHTESGSSSPSRKRTHQTDDEIIDVVPKLAKTVDAYQSAPILAPFPQDIPFKNERNEVEDNEIIFLQNTFGSGAGGSALNNGARPTLDLQIPTATSLEQSFEELFTQSDIQGVGESFALTASSPFSAEHNIDTSKVNDHWGQFGSIAYSGGGKVSGFI